MSPRPDSPAASGSGPSAGGSPSRRPPRSCSRGCWAAAAPSLPHLGRRRRRRQGQQQQQQPPTSLLLHHQPARGGPRCRRRHPRRRHRRPPGPSPPPPLPPPSRARERKHPNAYFVHASCCLLTITMFPSFRPPQKQRQQADGCITV